MDQAVSLRILQLIWELLWTKVFSICCMFSFG
jgi:hypothetical protein